MLDAHGFRPRLRAASLKSGCHARRRVHLHQFPPSLEGGLIEVRGPIVAAMAIRGSFRPRLRAASLKSARAAIRRCPRTSFRPRLRAASLKFTGTIFADTPIKLFPPSLEGGLIEVGSSQEWRNTWHIVSALA